MTSSTPGHRRAEATTLVSLPSELHPLVCVWLPPTQVVTLASTCRRLSATTGALLESPSFIAHNLKNSSSCGDPAPKPHDHGAFYEYSDKRIAQLPDVFLLELLRRGGLQHPVFTPWIAHGYPSHQFPTGFRPTPCLRLQRFQGQRVVESLLHGVRMTTHHRISFAHSVAVVSTGHHKSFLRSVGPQNLYSVAIVVAMVVKDKQYEKEVGVRWTMDGWKTFCETSATFLRKEDHRGTLELWTVKIEMDDVIAVESLQSGTSVFGECQVAAFVKYGLQEREWDPWNDYKIFAGERGANHSISVAKVEDEMKQAHGRIFRLLSIAAETLFFFEDRVREAYLSVLNGAILDSDCDLTLRLLIASNSTTSSPSEHHSAALKLAIQSNMPLLSALLLGLDTDSDSHKNCCGSNHADAARHLAQVKTFTISSYMGRLPDSTESQVYRSAEIVSMLLRNPEFRTRDHMDPIRQAILLRNLPVVKVFADAGLITTRKSLEILYTAGKLDIRRLGPVRTLRSLVPAIAVFESSVVREVELESLAMRSLIFLTANVVLHRFTSPAIIVFPFVFLLINHIDQLAILMLVMATLPTPLAAMFYFGVVLKFVNVRHRGFRVAFSIISLLSRGTSTMHGLALVSALFLSLLFLWNIRNQLRKFQRWKGSWSELYYQ